MNDIFEKSIVLKNVTPTFEKIKSFHVVLDNFMKFDRKIERKVILL